MVEIENLIAANQKSSRRVMTLMAEVDALTAERDALRETVGRQRESLEMLGPGIARLEAEYNDLMERYNHQGRVITERESMIEGDTRRILALTAQRDTLMAALELCKPLMKDDVVEVDGDGFGCFYCGENIEMHSSDCRWKAARLAVFAALRQAGGGE